MKPDHLAARGNPRASGYYRASDDWYREPPWLVDALLDVERFEGPILDPACGAGTIVARCWERKLTAIGTDIAARGFGEQMDFFTRERPTDNIICNPPFDIAQEFIEHALKITKRKVAILQRLAFLEGQKRKKFFETSPLARVWVSSRRACMPPGSLSDYAQRDGWGAVKVPEATGGAIAYAWFVWECRKSYCPTFPQLGWI